MDNCSLIIMLTVPFNANCDRQNVLRKFRYIHIKAIDTDYTNVPLQIKNTFLYFIKNNIYLRFCDDRNLKQNRHREIVKLSVVEDFKL